MLLKIDIGIFPLEFSLGKKAGGGGADSAAGQESGREQRATYCLRWVPGYRGSELTQPYNL
jgi:hypothetical protein